MGCRDGLWWRDVLYPMLWRRDHVDARRGEWRSLSHVSSLELSAIKRRPSRYLWPLALWPLQSAQHSADHIGSILA